MTYNEALRAVISAAKEYLMGDNFDPDTEADFWGREKIWDAICVLESTHEAEVTRK